MSGGVEHYGRLRVPADATGARRYLRDTLFIPHGWRERLKLQRGRLSPDIVAPMNAAPQDESDRKAVQMAAEAIGLRTPVGSWIAVDDYAGSRRVSIAVLFDSPESVQPVAFVKVRAAGDGPSLSREMEALNELAAGPLAETVPRVRAWIDAGSYEVLALSPVAGAPMLREMKVTWRPSHSVTRHFSLAGDWLESFQRGRKAGTHGDFWARNVLIGGNRVSIVDWECFDAAGDPLHDVFQFAFTYALAFRWDLRDTLGPVERFRRAFATPHRLSRVIRDWMTRFGSLHSSSPAELQRRMSRWLSRGVDGTVDRPRLSREQWAAMIEILEGRAQCVFSG